MRGYSKDTILLVLFYSTPCILSSVGLKGAGLRGNSLIPSPQLRLVGSSGKNGMNFKVGLAGQTSLPSLPRETSLGYG